MVEGHGAESNFHALVFGALTCGIVGAWSRPGVAAMAIGLVGAAGAAAAATLGAAHPPDGALVGAFASLVAVFGLSTGLATLGRSLRCPDPGAAICALVVVLAGLTAIRWVDPAAERLSLDRRANFRQAVLRADLATAAAYDVAGYDRLHAPDIYEDTTIASLPLALPEVLPCAAAWGGVGLAFGLLGGVVHWIRRRVRPCVTALASAT